MSEANKNFSSFEGNYKHAHPFSFYKFFKLKSIADKCVRHTAVFRLIHKDNVLYGKNISALKTN